MSYRRASDVVTCGIGITERGGDEGTNGDINGMPQVAGIAINNQLLGGCPPHLPYTTILSFFDTIHLQTIYCWQFFALLRYHSRKLK